ncbi:MAG TPA: PilZ domain-containing protein [Terriglobales bacterium]|jgi:CheY-like chemotaxis protein
MSLTSLLVCDDTRTVQVLNRALEASGISAQPCDDFEVALDRLTRHSFDALLIDCEEEASAIQFVGEAKHSPDNNSALIVGLVNSQNNVRELFERGINFVLYKPLSHERASASLRAAKTLMHRERRQHPRVTLHATASLDYAGTEGVPATVLELSQSGIAIQCERKLPPRCKVYFQFLLPGHASAVRASGQVMWQDSAGRVGIRFADVPQFSRQALTRWLEKNSALNAQCAISPLRKNKSTGSDTQDASLVRSSEHRGSKRHPCRLSADVSVIGKHVPQRCYLSDLSVGGCYVDTTEPLSVMTEVEIVVRAMGSKVRLMGVVRGTHPAFGMGVSFTFRTPEERTQLRRLVESLPEESAAL